MEGVRRLGVHRHPTTLTPHRRLFLLTLDRIAIQNYIQVRILVGNKHWPLHPLHPMAHAHLRTLPGTLAHHLQQHLYSNRVGCRRRYSMDLVVRTD